MDQSILTETNITEIMGEYKRLSWSASHGVDLIFNTVLKTFAATLAPFITDPISQSLKNQAYPIDFNNAIVLPPHKKGSTSNVNIYWPISILPSFGKNLCSREAVSFRQK